jgi:hypothetical protein
MLFVESSLNELYRSAVEAFPHTTKRQHATHTIEVTNLVWTPFIGMKTLMVKGLAQNEGKEYTCYMVFKNVLYHPDRDDVGLVEVRDITGAQYLLERLSLEDTDVLVRCSCPDFAWRFNYSDHLSHDLMGRKRKKYEAIHNPGSANPNNDKGLCKHLMKMSQIIAGSNVIE